MLAFVVVVVVYSFVVEEGADKTCRTTPPLRHAIAILRSLLFLNLLPHHRQQRCALEQLMGHALVPLGPVGRVTQQLDGGVVCGFQTVVAEAAVADQFQTLGFHRVAGLLGVVTSLEDGLEKVLGIVGELVDKQVSNFEIDKFPSVHQPPQVGRGDCFPHVKGARVHRSGRLVSDVLFDVCFVVGVAVVVANLPLGEGRDFAGRRSVFLNAESESSSRSRIRRRFCLFPPFDGDKACD